MKETTTTTKEALDEIHDSTYTSPDIEDDPENEQTLRSTSKLIQEIQKQLNEEKWTRSTIESYSKKHFVQLDESIHLAKKDGVIEELRLVCLDHIKHSSNSIIALYIVGVIHQEEEIVGENYLYKLLNVFKDNRKWNLVQLLADKILEYGEDKTALLMLHDCYEYSGQTDDLHKIWERLAKIDFENGEIAKRLGDYYDRKKDKEKSIYYYKTALRRFARQQSMNHIEEIWIRLAQLIPQDIDFFYSLEKEIARKNPEQLADLFLTNAKYAMNEMEIPQAIQLYKKILTYNPKDRDSRNQLVQCYQLKYIEHTRLSEYLKISEIENSNIDAKAAIDSFEKHIAFDKGHYVYHRSWGIGFILDMRDDYLIIDFKTKKQHQMSLKMALNSLKVLADNHIWVVKEKDPESLRDESEAGIENALKIFFKSYDNEAMMKDIKAELVPNVIAALKWTKWWTKAKKVMKTSSEFGYSPAKKDLFFLRDKPLTYEEETFFNFSNAKSYDEKLLIFLDFLKHTDVVNTDTVQEMVSFFINMANKQESIDQRTFQSYILSRRLRKQLPGIASTLNFHSKELFAVDRDVLISIYDNLFDADFKKDMLNLIRRHEDDWAPIFLSCFYTKITRAHNYIIDQLYEQSQKSVLKQAFDYIMTNPRQHLENFVWAIRLLFNRRELIAYLDFNIEDLIINLIKVLEYLNKEIENKQDIAFHRKIHGQIVDILIRDEALIDYLKYELTTEEKATRLHSLIMNTASFSSKERTLALDIIYAKFPALDKGIEVEVEEDTTTPFWVTKLSFEQKQKELNVIMNEEIPKNSKDIGEAQEKGDLRENAEYEAALDRQRTLKSMAAKLSDELRRAKVIHPKDVDISQVSVGTKIVLLNIKGKSKAKEEFTILGDWDTRPEKNIISYHSPLGQSLLNARENEEVGFTHAKKTKYYKIISIELADQLK